jgi:MurNAc alpha-1-phosphate uridylyltransferase
MVDVAGKPFALHQLDQLRQQGVKNVVFCLGHLGEMIEACVGNGHAFGLDVTYSRDGAKPLGTGGAIRRALPLLGKNFFVLYGDVYLPIDFNAVGDAFLTCGKPALMTVLRNQNRWNASNVRFSEGRIEEYNKRNPSQAMDYIDFGLGVYNCQVFSQIPEGQQFDLSDLQHSLSISGQIAGYEVFDRYYEIGSHDGLRETENYLVRRM